MSRGTGLFSTTTPRRGPGLAGRDLAPTRRDLWKTDPSPYVISVGNLAVGGRGKTPVVAALASRLIAAGERPAILSRGYKRRRPQDGVVIVSDGVHIRADLDLAGDEPLMLARRLPAAAVLVCDVRAMAAAVATHTLRTTVQILDDGFQHVALARHLDLVIITPEDLRDRRMPLGTLRSSVTALRRADAVIVECEDLAAVTPLLATVISAERTRVFRLRRSIGAPQPLEAQRPWPTAPGPVVALAGIARPQRFARALEAAGWQVVRTLAFADHHPYRPADLHRIARAVHETGAGAVLTTEKDAVRLLPLRPLPVPIAAVPLEVAIDPPGEFDRWLAARLAEGRA